MSVDDNLNVQPVSELDASGESAEINTATPNVDGNNNHPPVQGDNTPPSESDSNNEEEGQAGKQEGNEEEDKDASKDKEADKEEEEEIVPFAAFQGLREEMAAAGVDFSVMDAKVEKLEPLNEEELALIAEHKKADPKDVKAYMDLEYSRAKQMKAEQEAFLEQYYGELDSLAGGNHRELMDFVGKNASEAKNNIWQAALDTKDTNVQKEVIKEMKAFRDSNVTGGEGGETNKSDLSLLTQGQSQGAKTKMPQKQHQDSSDADAEAAATNNPPLSINLDGNPCANLSFNALCQIKMHPRHENYQDAVAVLQAKFPNSGVV